MRRYHSSGKRFTGRALVLLVGLFMLLSGLTAGFAFSAGPAMPDQIASTGTGDGDDDGTAVAWIAEVEPETKCVPKRNVDLVTVLKGRWVEIVANHEYHPFDSSHTAPPSTPPPDRAA